MRMLRTIFCLTALISLPMYGEQACPKAPWTETEHEILLDKQKVSYKATTGSLILQDESCADKGEIFFISYIKHETSPSNRPVTFCFNGGPGSCSVWLHMGLAGPKKIACDATGTPAFPYRLEENPCSLLDVTDLVFIDPVGTGYSQAIPPDKSKDFFSVEGDAKSLGEFIRLYLTRFNRWTSPKFLMGESYGTIRAVELATYLQDKQYISVDGLILISSCLNLSSLYQSLNTDLPYLVSLPSCTAAAWQHGKLPPSLQEKPLEQALKESCDFVINTYVGALFKGDLLPEDEKTQLTQKLSELTGLSTSYVDRSNLRIDTFHFLKELLREEKTTIGVYDCSQTGIDGNHIGEFPDYDPSLGPVLSAFTTTFHDYLQNDLQSTSLTDYKILAPISRSWDFGSGTCRAAFDTSENLRAAMSKNSHMKVLVASGYFDLATPFFATEYTFAHLGLTPEQQGRVTMHNYEGGHMMYLYPQTLIQMASDIRNFYH